MSDQRDPYPYLGRVPAGPVRDSLRLLWDQFTAVKGAFPAGFFSTGGAAGSSSGTVLTVANVDRVQAFAAQTIPDSALTALTWLQDGLVTGGPDARELINIGATPTRFTIPRRFAAGGITTPSVWVVTVNLTWDINAVGYRQLILQWTTPSSTLSVANVSHPPATGQTTGQSATAILMNPPGGSYVVASAQQNSGGGVISSAMGSLVQLF